IRPGTWKFSASPSVMFLAPRGIVRSAMYSSALSSESLCPLTSTFQRTLATCRARKVVAKWSSPTIRQYCQRIESVQEVAVIWVPMASSNGTKVAAVRALRRNAMPGRLASFAEDSCNRGRSEPDEHRVSQSDHRGDDGRDGERDPRTETPGAGDKVEHPTVQPFSEAFGDLVLPD